MNDDGTNAPHSALYLNDDRDSWWNTDYLWLLGARLGFAREDAIINNVLDVGCGKGHWTRIVATMAPASARIVGVDFEPQWVAEAQASQSSSNDRITYRQGDAHALPFPNAFFDVVTCQTVLIHVKDVVTVLKEMTRVLRPGGRVFVAEPNNLAETFARLVGDPAFDLDEVLAATKLDAICQKGKHALGNGYNSTGELMVKRFADAGLVDIQAWGNDKCQLEVMPNERAHFDAGHAIWPKDETLRYFEAGLKAPGVNASTVEDFEVLWTKSRQAWAKRFEPGYFANEGGLFYVVTGVKPG